MTNYFLYAIVIFTMMKMRVSIFSGAVRIATACCLVPAVLSSCSGSTGPSGFIDIGNNNASIVLASGDSVTFGSDSFNKNGYRKRLETLLSLQDKFVAVINGGRPGACSGDAHLMLADMAKYRPAVVVLNYGLNDALVISESTAPGIVANLKGMVHAVLNNKSIAVLTTLTPTCGYRVQQNEIVNQVNKGLRDMVEEFEGEDSFVFADVASAFAREDPASTGCSYISSLHFNHPNDRGYRIMAEVIADSLSPLTW